jgi:hypothetical protein
MCWGIKLKNNDASATAAIMTSHLISMVLGILLIDIFSNAALKNKQNGNTFTATHYIPVKHSHLFLNLYIATCFSV